MLLAMTMAAACGLGDLTIDGRISDAEWAGASVHALENGGKMRIARRDDALCIAVEGQGGLHYADLYLAGPEGEIVNLHASMQAGIRRLPREGGWDDRSPDFVWGNTQGWRANTVGWLRGVDRSLPLEQRMTPYDGQEFEIDLSTLGTGPWRLRVEASDFRHQPRGDGVWPAGSNRTNVGGWMALD